MSTKSNQSEPWRDNFPGVTCIIESAWDFPTAINLSGVEIWTPPVIYYKHDEVEGVHYDLYCLFFMKDTNHQYDFQGFIQRLYHPIFPGPTRLARNHHDIVDVPLLICAAGHHNPVGGIPIDNHYFSVGNGAEFVDMTRPDFKEKTKEIFTSGVSHPDQWMSPWCREQGLIYNDPAAFFELSMKEGI